VARFLLKRFALSLITLFILSVIVFAAAQLLPGNIGRNVLGPFASPHDVWFIRAYWLCSVLSLGD